MSPRQLRPERRTLSQAITQSVLERIRAGEFRPGDRLPTEKDLMEEYGVGRNATREAVQALVAMGLVEVRPGRGATLLSVTGGGMDSDTVSALLSDQAIEDLYEFRRLLEVEMATRAAERATDDEVADIEAACTRFHQAATRSNAASNTVSTLDDEFHAAIARASRNALYSTVFDAISDLIDRARELTAKVPWAVERALVEHEAITKAIAAHDSSLAAGEMRVHIDGAIEAIRAGLAAQTSGEKPGDAPAPVASVRNPR